MRIAIHESVPKYMHEQLERMLKKFVPLMYPEVEILEVRFKDMEQADAAIYVRRNYRRAVMCLTAAWASSEPEDQEWLIAHEFAHILTSPLHEMVSSTVGKLGEEAGALAEDWYEQANEAATDSFARVLIRALNLGGCCVRPDACCR